MALQRLCWVLIFMIALVSCDSTEKYKKNIDPGNMMIRIAEAEIKPEYLTEYLSILKAESKTSIELESRVISIYPMYQKENPNEIKILEIYADEQAYQTQLQTLHFKQYKTSTEHMVKSLKLIDRSTIDGQTMSMIFKKINRITIT